MSFQLTLDYLTGNLALVKRQVTTILARLTQAGDNRITQAGDYRITQDQA